MKCNTEDATIDYITVTLNRFVVIRYLPCCWAVSQGVLNFHSIFPLLFSNYYPWRLPWTIWINSSLWLVNYRNIPRDVTCSPKTLGNCFRNISCTKFIDRSDNSLPSVSTLSLISLSYFKDVRNGLLLSLFTIMEKVH